MTAASEEIGLAQPTISTQIRIFEESLGHPLFDRIGWRLELTETGRTVYRYAGDIFSLGRELQQLLDGSAPDHRERLRVGVADAPLLCDLCQAEGAQPRGGKALGEGAHESTFNH